MTQQPFVNNDVMKKAIWDTADKFLRNVVEEQDYGDYIIPFAVLRRLECLLADTKPQVLSFLSSEQAKSANSEWRDRMIRTSFKLHFYNSSALDLASISATDDRVKEGLEAYVGSFSSSIGDIWDRFKFGDRIETLDRAGRLWGIARHFASLDMHPDRMPDNAMGDIFEDVMYRAFSLKGKGAGAFYTPRDAISLMVDILFSSDDEGLRGSHPARSVYDPTAGTGGMLLVANRALKDLNPSIDVGMYGQELMDVAYAIGKADLLIQGGRPDAIRQGNTLRRDEYVDQTFDYVLSNPPFGTDWSDDQVSVKEQSKSAGTRFSHGLPATSDGQMLFLCHVATKLAPAGKNGAGGRGAVVSNGSPLFTGGPETGPDSIRSWLFTSDLVDAVIALPTNMFFGTGIATYVWILDTNKEERRKGKIQLIDGSNLWHPMAKGMGEKRREMIKEDRDAVLDAYQRFEDNDISKVVTPADLGYRDVPVFRARRLATRVTDETVSEVLSHAHASESLEPILRSLEGKPWNDLPVLIKDAATGAKIKVSTALMDTIMRAVAVDDPDAPFAVDRKGNSVMVEGSKMIQRVPLSEDVTEHMKREVLPFAPGSIWDESKSKVGYEVPMTRFFYKPTAMRSLDDIDTEVLEVMRSLGEKFKAVHG